MTEVRDTPWMKLRPDAIILSTKRIHGGKGARIEVVAGKDDGFPSSPPGRQQVDRQNTANQAFELGIGGLTREIVTMKAMLREMNVEDRSRGEWREFKEMLEALFDMFGLRKGTDSSHPLAQVYRHLTDCGISKDRASNLTTALRREGAEEITSCEAGLSQIEQSLSQRLASFCTHEEKGKRVKAFFCPTGVGKTTTIAKLASLYSLERKVDVGLMTKIDECPRAGFVYNVVDQLAKPVSYMTNGQNGPFDIKKASPASMARLIVRNTLH